MLVAISGESLCVFRQTMGQECVILVLMELGMMLVAQRLLAWQKMLSQAYKMSRSFHYNGFY